MSDVETASASPAVEKQDPEHEGTMPHPADLLAKPLVDLAKEEVKGVIDWAKKWVRSHSVMIVGQERAGKTNFFRYLKYQTRRPEERTPKTPKPIRSGVLTLKLNDRLQATVRNYFDLPGQISPSDLADKIVRKKPYLVVVFLNLRLPFEAQNMDQGELSSIVSWTDAFLSRLADKARDNKKVARKVRHIIFVLNKVDLLSGGRHSTDIPMMIARIRKEINVHLRPCFGNRVENFPVLPCQTIFNGQLTQMPLLQGSTDTSSLPHGAADNEEYMIKRVIEDMLLLLQKENYGD